MIDKVRPWAQAVLTTGGIVASVLVYAFTNFQTKSEAKDIDDQHDKDITRIEKKIDRMEDKIDALLTRWPLQKDELRRR